MSERIRLEWVENGKPKQVTADAMIYQLGDGSWRVVERLARLVLVRNGGSTFIHALDKYEPNLFQQRELQRRRRNSWFLSGVAACAFTLIGAGLSILLL